MIRQKIALAWNSKLLRDNLVLFVGSFVAGGLGFLYHFYMARILGPEQYGVLGTILSAFYMVNIAFTNTIQAAISRFAVSFWVKKSYSHIKALLVQSTKRMFLYSLLMYAAYFALVPFLSTFLAIDRGILYFSGLLIFFALLVPIGRGILQGCQFFPALSFNLLVEGIVKLSSGVLFVFLGYRVFGAIGAILLAYTLVILFFFFPLRIFFRYPSHSFNTKEVYAYSFPVFFMLLSLTAFFSIDVVLVKHFFDPAQAGYYSALSLLGKVIFFGSVSITQVMFAKTSEFIDEKSDHWRLFLKSLLIMLACLGVALVVYFAFPRLLILILFGDKFLTVVPYVGWFGLFIVVYSLVYFTSFYYAALKKRFFVFLLLLFNVLQALLLWLYHGSFTTILLISTLVMAALFALLFFPLLFSPSMTKL